MAAPSDELGHDAVETMLMDLDFPRTAREVRERAGNWRVPVEGSEETVSLRDLLGNVPDDRRFGSAREVARAVAREHKGF